MGQQRAWGLAPPAKSLQTSSSPSLVVFRLTGDLPFVIPLARGGPLVMHFLALHQSDFEFGVLA
jgi:hypothetical protein